MVVVEIKGGSVWRTKKGEWLQASGGGSGRDEENGDEAFRHLRGA